MKKFLCFAFILVIPGSAYAVCGPPMTTSLDAATTSSVTVSEAVIQARVSDPGFVKLGNDLDLSQSSRARLAEIWERRNAEKSAILARHRAAVNELDAMLATDASISTLNEQIVKIDGIEQELRDNQKAVLNEVKLALGVEKTAKFIVYQRNLSDEPALGGGMTVETEADFQKGKILENPTAYQFESRSEAEFEGRVANPTSYF